MPRYLAYNAGPAALARIAARGFSLADVGTLVAPATGPKWLVAAGFDRALMRDGTLGRDRRVLLAGASAGAWRALSLASPDPTAAHARLLEHYVSQVFTAADSPERISDAYRALLRQVLPREHGAHVLAHPRFALALHAVRVQGWVGARGALQKVALGTAALSHALAQQSARLFFEPTQFATAGTPREWLDPTVAHATLDADNLHDVALASGSVPMYMAPVAIGAGRYLDGGLSDYHIRRRLGPADRLALMFSHQRKLVPAWFDKFVPWRAPPRAATDNLLLVHPTPEFLALLPERRVPTREDFTRFVDRPAERIRRWRAAAAESDRLGEQLLSDIAENRIAQLVRPL